MRSRDLLKRYDGCEVPYAHVPFSLADTRSPVKVLSGLDWMFTESPVPLSVGCLQGRLPVPC